MADTRQLFDSPGRRLSIGGAATAAQNPRGAPGVYQSGTSSNVPGNYQSPTQGLTMVQTTRPGEGINTDPDRAGSGGTITRNGVVTRVAPTPGIPKSYSDMTSAMNQAAMAAKTSYSDFLRSNPNSPAATGSLASPQRQVPPPRQQTEAANPLTGDDNSIPGGDTAGISAPRALGFSSRGPTVPRGQDAMGSVQGDLRSMSQGVQNDLRGTASTGGSGLFRRTFSNPASASRYDNYIKTLFGNLQTA